MSTPTAGPVCADCWADVVEFIPPLCPQCGAPVPLGSRSQAPAGDCTVCRAEPLTAITRAAALGPYEGTLRHVVHALKFRRCPTLGERLASRLRGAHGDLLTGADAVVPVPLHGARRRARGFNQAHAIARHLGPPVLPALRRVRRTAAQASLDGGARRRNVRGAFALARWLGAISWARRLRGTRDPEEGRFTIAGRVFVLVDDVWTTGATLSECATVLAAAGASEVRALTIARALPARLTLPDVGDRWRDTSQGLRPRYPSDEL